MNLVPTASTTAALALGDALAMTLSVRKGFREEDFASLHPGGTLGKRLVRVERLMHVGTAVPRVTAPTAMRDVIYEMSSKGLGMTCVTDEAGRLIGLIADGDLRRHMADTPLIMDRLAADVMTTTPRTIARSMLAVEALHVMEQHKITSLMVVDPGGVVEGVIHIHDLWRTEAVLEAATPCRSTRNSRVFASSCSTSTAC